LQIHIVYFSSLYENWFDIIFERDIAVSRRT